MHKFTACAYLSLLHALMPGTPLPAHLQHGIAAVCNGTLQEHVVRGCCAAQNSGLCSQYDYLIVTDHCQAGQCKPRKKGRAWKRLRQTAGNGRPNLVTALY
jgi:hypothetical protein